MTPRATLRLQFHKDFSFADAERRVPYMAGLGISHVYASPITTARPGSLHGYDVIDPTAVNPELGGEAGLRSLVAALRPAGIGLIVDIVPNHMAADLRNPWWVDVLREGRGSRYAGFFDIDWERGGGKVLLPVLDKPLKEAVRLGSVSLESHPSTGPLLRCGPQLFPLSGGLADCGDVLAVHEQQHYRLAWWRVAGDELNWRRFFDINELVSVRQEDNETFAATHALILRLYEEQLVDGVRIDHVDGLRDPGGYCRKLRAALAAACPSKRPYILVEKILLRGETLPEAWETDGTTGYDFMDEVNAVQHDPAGEMPLTRLWTDLSGRPADFSVEEEAARREIVARSFSGQLDACVAACHPSLEGLLGGDLGRPTLRRALVEVLAHFPVYRTYGAGPALAEDERCHISEAIEAARRSCLATDRWAVDLVHRWLEQSSDDCVHLFQQLSAPIAAKAVEDTAFYRYGRLLSRNDVGFDMRRFSQEASDYHVAAHKRLARYPHALLSTATHDHKRGEDVRARLAVLSERADEWQSLSLGWIARTASLRSAAGPSEADVAMLLQTIIGAWPLDLDRGDAAGRLAYADRLADWQTKALREAKLRSDWASPDDAYEEAARRYLMALVAEARLPDVLDELVDFVDDIAPAAAVNGLAQLLLKLTSPGVPDIYQGTDFWDFSLVDPDNRRAVDYAARENALRRDDQMATLLAFWRDGRIKQAIIARTLALRRRHEQLFTSGTYEPVAVEGHMARHVIAYARRHRETTIMTVVPRLPSVLLAMSGALALNSRAWRDTMLRWPGQGPLIDAFSGARVTCIDGVMPLANICSGTPVALLCTART